jgi:ribulose kinase
LEQLVKDDFEQLGGIPGKNGVILTAGQPVGQGLSKQAAEELGLVEGTAVGSGVIDAWVKKLTSCGKEETQTNS